MRGRPHTSSDTDTTNTPMVAAFADIGRPRTETRIDFTVEP